MFAIQCQYGTLKVKVLPFPGSDATEMVPPADKEAAGTIMLFALQGGLTVGSTISMILPYVFHFSQ